MEDWKEVDASLAAAGWSWAHSLASPTADARESKSAVQCVRTTLNPPDMTGLGISSLRNFVTLFFMSDC